MHRPQGVRAPAVTLLRACMLWGCLLIKLSSKKLSCKTHLIYATTLQTNARRQEAAKHLEQGVLVVEQHTSAEAKHLFSFGLPTHALKSFADMNLVRWLQLAYHQVARDSFNCSVYLVVHLTEAHGATACWSIAHVSLCPLRSSVTSGWYVCVTCWTVRLWSSSASIQP